MTKVQKLIMFVGLPGSGKTSKAKEMMNNSFNIIKRVNKDDLRAMLDGGAYSPKFEPFIKLTEEAIARAALAVGCDVIVDDTNLKETDEEHWRKVASEANVPFEVVVFSTPVEVCIARDALRKKPVGKDTIMHMFESYSNRIMKGENTNVDSKS